MNMLGLKVLVTGGAGFLGSHITEQLVAEGATVSVLDTFQSSSQSNIAHLVNFVKLYQGDILDPKIIKQAIKGVDVVVHAAFPMAICDRSLEKQYIEAGTVGIYNLLTAALAENALFVYVSSISVYGKQEFVPITEDHPLHPMLIYGTTKLAGELYCRIMAEEYGLRTVILRYSDIYGPRNGRISAPINFLLRSLNNQPLYIQGTGAQIRSYTYVSDAIKATMLAIANPDAVGKTFNVAGDDNLSIIQLAQKVNKVTGNQVDIFCYEHDQDMRNYIIDNTQAKKILGFKPEVGLEEGLSLTLKWLENNQLHYQSFVNQIKTVI